MIILFILISLNVEATFVPSASTITADRELLKIEANGNDGDVITVDTEKIIFKTEITDNKNAWASDTFTVPTDYGGRYHISGHVRATGTISSWSTRIKINGTNEKYCGRQESGTILPFDCYVDLADGDTLGISSTDGFTVATGDDLHFLSIEQQASSTFISSPIDSQKQICQTKFQSADMFGSNGTLSGLTFNSLTVGKSYRYTFNGVAEWALAASSDFSVEGRNDGADICKTYFGGGKNTTTYRDGGSSTCYFVAAATVLTVETADLAGSTGDIMGDGSTESNAVLCELPDNYNIESTKFN